MKIADTAPAALCNELELLLDTVPLDGAEVLELGCGKAEKTRRLAASPRIARVLALEVDAIQHASNLCIADAPKVEFRAGGAEAVPAEDARFDLVVMFRSLHHVPVDKMDDALAEIARVLKPGAGRGFPSLSTRATSTRCYACSTTSAWCGKPRSARSAGRWSAAH